MLVRALVMYIYYDVGADHVGRLTPDSQLCPNPQHLQAEETDGPMQLPLLFLSSGSLQPWSIDLGGPAPL